MKIVEETPYRFRIEQEGAMRVPGIVFASGRCCLVTKATWP